MDTEEVSDERMIQAARDNLTLGALQGKELKECPLCKGEGVFDRLWPGNTELCFYCAGLKVVLPDAKQSDPDRHSRRLRFATLGSRKKVVERQGYNG